MLNIKKIVLLYLVVILFAGCNIRGMDIINSSASRDVIKNKNGEKVRECDGSLLINGGAAVMFWKQNNLPEGTTEFVCKNGKAYLPNQVPNGQ